MSLTPKWDKSFSPSEATRGSWTPLDTSSSTEYPSSGRGKYAQLNYIVGSEPGALNLALSGGNVILPVSSVNINEPLEIMNSPGLDFVVTSQQTLSTYEIRPDTTSYQTTSIAPTSVSTILFTPKVVTVEVFNNDQNIPAYVNFNSSALATVSSQGLPILPESFYSVDRETTRMYIGNANASTSIDVRIIGHYRNA